MVVLQLREVKPMFYYGLYKNKQKLYCVENINRGGSMQKAKTYLNKIFLTLAYALITLLNFIWLILTLKMIYLVIFDPSNLYLSKEPRNIYWDMAVYLASSIFLLTVLYYLFKSYLHKSGLGWKHVAKYYLVYVLYILFLAMYIFWFSYTVWYQLGM